MRAPVQTIAGLLALLVVDSGSWGNAALGQGNVSGMWTSASDSACPLAFIEIKNTGSAEAWTADGELDPFFSDLEGRVKMSGSTIELNMKEGGAGLMRMSLRGTIAGNQITAQVTLTEGKKKQSGSCIFARK